MKDLQKALEALADLNYSCQLTFKEGNINLMVRRIDDASWRFETTVANFDSLVVWINKFLSQGNP